MRYIEFIALI
jgi:small nuclear ribonucleoprotein (snRNP)-like protein